MLFKAVSQKRIRKNEKEIFLRVLFRETSVALLRHAHPASGPGPSFALKTPRNGGINR